jgi:acylphosphatase
MLKEEIHLIFRGNVQGVGFRAKAKKIADQLHLTGYAQNLSDGSVEVSAQGNRSELIQFIEQLQMVFGKETLASQSFRPLKEEWNGFLIK